MLVGVGQGDDREHSLHQRLHARYLAWLESAEADDLEVYGRNEDEQVDSLCAFTVRATSSVRLGRAHCAALASSVPPNTVFGGGSYKVRVGNAEEELWRGQRKLLELFFYEMPSSPLLAADESGGAREQEASRDVAIEATYSLPPAVELHPPSIFSATKKKQSIIHLGPMKTY